MKDCQAKNPATCRYHGALSQDSLKEQRTTVNNMYTNVLETYQKISVIKPELAEQYLDAFREMEKIKEDADIYYYGTDEGAAELEELKNNTEDLNEILQYETLQRVANAKRKVVEDNPNTPTVLFPAHEKIFTFPVIEVKKNKLSEPVEIIGNKYNSTNTLPRIRDMVKADLKKAMKLGFVPESTFKVTSDLKQGSVSVFIDNPDIEVHRRVKKIIGAYYKETRTPDNAETPVTKNFNLIIKKPKPVTA